MVPARPGRSEGTRLVSYAVPLLKLGSMSFYCHEEGSGFPVLFIHGLGSDHTGWNQYLRPLSSTFRCVAFDNRDVGRSDRASEAYDIRDMANDARALLDELGITKAHVVGFSMGASIAQELVLAHPECVQSLVLVSGYTSSDPRGEALFNGWKLLRKALSPEDYAQITLPWVYTHQEYRTPGFVDNVIEATAQDPLRQDDAAFARQVDATLSFSSEDRLHSIAVPTLAIAGQDDLLAPMRFARTLEEGIPNCRLEIIPDAGHGLLWTRAKEVRRLLLEFLTERSPAGD